MLSLTIKIGWKNWKKLWSQFRIEKANTCSKVGVFVRIYYINVYCLYKSEQVNSCLCILLVLLNNYIQTTVCLFAIKLSENSKNRWIFQGNKSEQIFAFVHYLVRESWCTYMNKCPYIQVYRKRISLPSLAGLFLE